MSARIGAFAPALFAALALTSGAQAYNRQRSNWNPASLPIAYRVNVASIPASLGATVGQAAIDQGMASWAAPACTRWRATNAGNTSVTAARAGDRENSFLWISGAWPAELGAVNTTIGVTTPVWTSGGYYIDADIQFNNVGFRWSTTGTGNTVDAQSIATHEEGHFLGLDHTTVRGAVMFPSYSGGLLRTLNPDDVAGVCAIYPSGAAVPDAGVTPPTDPCAAYTSCAGCTPVNNCGWCGATGRCATGSAAGPSAGSCAGGYAWQPTECTAAPVPDAGTSTDPCARYTTCDTCAPVNNCGWCGATNRCATGTPTGPSAGTCGGNYVWDPAACGTSTTPGGTTQFGEPCRASGDCASGGPCLNLVNASGQSVRTFCSQVCIDDCTCPRGYRCGVRLSNGQMLCVPGTNSCPAAMPDASVVPPDAPAPVDAPVAADIPASPDDARVTADAADDVAQPTADAAPPSGGTSTGAASSGCGCTVPGPASTRGSAYLLALAGLCLAARRRARR